MRSELRAPRSAFLRVIGWLVRDTFRQSLSSYAFWLMLAVAGLCILLCLSISVNQHTPLKDADDIAINPERGDLSIGFGAVRYPLFRDGQAAVHFIQVVLGKWVAGTVGLLLALIWTAGFIPSFLEPSSATVLLAKPPPRWVLLLGKLTGVLVFVALQAAVFVLGTWLALGLRTGVWNSSYLPTLPLFLLHFVMIYGFSVLLGVCTRSPVVCVFGSILFWLLCYATNYGRHAITAMPLLDPGFPGLPPVFQILLESGYWLLPKPADLGILLDHALQSQLHFPELAEFRLVQHQGAFYPVLSVLTSVLFLVLVFVVAARQLAKTDY